MKTSQIQLARTFIDAIIPGKRDELRALVADDVRFWLPRPTYPSPLVGADVVASALTSFAAVEYSRAKGVYGSVIEQGSTVVIEWKVEATLRSNGNDHENYYLWIFDFEDGLIAEIREYADTAVAQAATGDLPQEVIDSALSSSAHADP